MYIEALCYGRNSLGHFRLSVTVANSCRLLRACLASKFCLIPHPSPYTPLPPPPRLQQEQTTGTDRIRQSIPTKSIILYLWVIYYWLSESAGLQSILDSVTSTEYYASLGRCYCSIIFYQYFKFTIDVVQPSLNNISLFKSHQPPRF